jgi:hypothetical protein
MSGGFTRTGDKVANSLRRKIAVAIGTSAATAATVNPAQAHGRVGAQCLLTVALDNSFGSSPTITLQYWSEFAKQWFLAGTGISGGAQAVQLAPGGTTTFSLPEDTLYFIYSSASISANLLWTDGTDISAIPQTGTQ